MGFCTPRRSGGLRGLLWRSCLLLALAAPVRAQPTPELLLKNGHWGSITCLEFSPSGSHLATVAVDGTCKVWECEGARLYDTIRPPATPWSARFSPDGKSIVLGCQDGSVEWWDWASLRLVQTWKGPRQSKNPRPAVWGMPGDVTRGYQELAFSPDGTRLAAGGLRFVDVFDVRTGRVLASYKTPGLVVGLRGRAGALDVVCSGTERLQTIAWKTPGNDRPGPEREAAWELLPEGRACFVPGRDAALVAEDGKLSRVQGASGAGLGLPLTAPVALAAAEGPGLLACADGQEIVVQRGASVLRRLAGGARRLSLSPNGERMAWVDPAGALQLGLVASGSGQPLRGQTFALSDLELDAGQNRLAVAQYVYGSPSPGETPRLGSPTQGAPGPAGEVCLWDLATGKPIRASLTGATPTSVNFSGGDGLLVGDEQGQVTRARLEAGHLRAEGTFPKPADVVGRVTGCRAVAGQVWVTHGDGFLLGYPDQGPPTRRCIPAPAEAFACDRAGRRYALWDGTVLEVGEAATLTPTMALPCEEDSGVSALVFSPDGSRVAWGTGNGMVFCKSLADDPQAPPRATRMHRGRVHSLCFDGAGRRLVSAGADQALSVWDVDQPKLSMRLKGHTGLVTKGVFGPGDRTILSASWDGSIRCWSSRDGALLATLVSFPDQDGWVVCAPNGLFDGSSAGQAALEWRLEGQNYRLEQFFQEAYTPGLLSRVLAGGALPDPKPLRQLGRPPLVRILSPDRRGTTSEAEAELQAEVRDQGGGVGEIRLFVNGARAPSAWMTGREGSSVRFRVKLSPGENKLRLTAMNGDGSVESRSDQVVLESAAQAGPAASRLFLLAVGIDDYGGDWPRLEFCGADARSMAALFRPGLFREVRPSLLVNAEATRSGILSALEKLSQEIQPQDTLVVYLSGHGQLVGDSFYYIPAGLDKAANDEVARQGLSSSLLSKALADVGASRQLLILDTCHSGASTTGMAALGQADGSALVRAQTRMARSSGVFLIASSGADDRSVEMQALGHGALTYSVLKALGGLGGPPGGPVNRQGCITAAGLSLFASEEVPEITRGATRNGQQPTLFSTGQDFPLLRAR